MSNIANIVAFDGATTPVSHTLLPDSVSKEKGSNMALWKEANASIPDDAQVRASLKRTRLGTGVTKHELRVEVPVMEAIGAANAQGYTAPPKVAFVDTIVITSLRSPRSTNAGHRLARQLALNIAGSVATSVAPVITGPVPEAFDLNIFPT